jgi:hypothetical protein
VGTLTFFVGTPDDEPFVREAAASLSSLSYPTADEAPRSLRGALRPTMSLFVCATENISSARDGWLFDLGRAARSR